MRRSFTLWMAVALHVVWGLLLWVDPTTLSVTSISMLRYVIDDAFSIGLLLLIASALAAWGIRKGCCRSSLVALLPQQFVLVVTALGAIQAIVLGTFAPGSTLRSRPFLIAALAPMILIAVFHTLAVLREYGALTRRPRA